MLPLVERGVRVAAWVVALSWVAKVVAVDGGAL